MLTIDYKVAREHVLANYPNDPLLRTIVLNLLEQLPKMEAVEAVHGRWIWKGGCFHCTNCKYTEDHITNYCPKCGAKMDGG